MYLYLYRCFRFSSKASKLSLLKTPLTAFLSKYLAFKSLAPNTLPGLQVELGTWVETLQAESRRYLCLRRELLIPARVVEFIKKIAITYGFPSLKGLSLRGCCLQGIRLVQYVCVTAKRVQ